MKIKDFRDGNKYIITMFRGEDKTIQIFHTEPSGSLFNPLTYTMRVEGRLSQSRSAYNFLFPIESVDQEDQIITIKLPASIINNSLRENKIYWRLIAEESVEVNGFPVILNTIIFAYGEIWLKDS